MKKILILVLVLCTIPLAVKLFTSISDRLSQHSIETKLRSKMNSQVDFYGKVIDQYGKPVEGAEVWLHLKGAYKTTEYKVKTDTAGCFEITKQSGFWLFVDWIGREGISGDDRKWGQEKVFEYSTGFVSHKDAPVLFKVRKQEPPTIVKEDRLFTSAYEVREAKYFKIDLVEMKINNQTSWYSDNHPDIVMRMITSPENKAVTFVMEAQDKDSGIMESEELLYVPPESGYKKTYKIVVPLGEEFEKKLYVKSRDGKIYSRLEVDFSNKNKTKYDYPLFRAKTRTNLIGERNFEYDSKLYDEYVKKQGNKSK